MNPLRDQIFAMPDVEEEVRFIPEWGCRVVVRGMTGAEREAFERWIDEARAAGTVRARVVALCARDEDGARIFEDSDVAALNARAVAPLDRIFTAVMRLSAVSKEDIREYEEKFAAIPSNGSSSDSP